MWQFYAEEPKRGELFGRGMSGMDKIAGYEPSLLLNGYPWDELDNGTVVDVGGSHGTISFSIARRFPRLRCIVQDLAVVIEKGKAIRPADLTDRVSFMEQ